jgi:hypothetical protein
MVRAMGPAEREAFLGSIRPEVAKEHHEQLREVFRAEMESRRATGGDQYFENLYWCAYLLWEVGDPSDVPMMWKAKGIDFDTAAGFDIQFLGGAGVEQTLAWLRSHGHENIERELATYPDVRENLDEWAAFSAAVLLSGAPVEPFARCVEEVPLPTGREPASSDGRRYPDATFSSSVCRHSVPIIWARAVETRSARAGSSATCHRRLEQPRRLRSAPPASRCPDAKRAGRTDRPCPATRRSRTRRMDSEPLASVRTNRTRPRRRP